MNYVTETEMSDSKKTKLPATLFSLEHLAFDYLPKRLGLFVIPLGIIVALVVNEPSKQLLFLFFSIFLGLVQVSNYFICWGAHRRLELRYGERYREKLKTELNRVGLNGLISRFWTGVSPE